MAVIGALLGGVFVLVLAFAARHLERNVETCLAAHAGCAIAMPLGLILCALAVPVPAMLVAEIGLAVAAAYFIRAAASVRLRTRAMPRA